MNLLLLHDSDWRDDGLVQIDGRRSRHLRSVLRVGVGDEVRAGRLNGLVGTARILSMADGTIVLEPRLESDPPPRTGLELLLAMPRPKVLRRVLQSAASIGVDRIVLVNANRVEKSYFDSPFLHPDSMHEQLFLGLEQARDTRLPEVVVRNRFRPFVEDEAPGMWRESLKFVAHPDELPTPPGPPNLSIASTTDSDPALDAESTRRSRGWSRGWLGAVRIGAAGWRWVRAFLRGTTCASCRSGDSLSPGDAGGAVGRVGNDAAGRLAG